MRLLLCAGLGLALLLTGCERRTASAPAAPPAGQAAEHAAGPGAPEPAPVAPPPVIGDEVQHPAGSGGNGGALVLLGQTISAGSTRRLSWSGGQSFDGTVAETPVLVVNGVADGPTLCLTAAVHGDELNGIEMVRRTLEDLQPGKLSGAVIGIPIVNLQGFRRSTRYLPDRRDLNRYFPGNANGSAASRIARSLFDNVIVHCDGLVDIHTGSLNRTNLLQIRADLHDEGVRAFAGAFGNIVIVHNPGTPGTLRRAAVDHGIPAVTLEAGEPGRLQSAQVRAGTAGIRHLIQGLGMTRKVRLLKEPRPIYYRAKWIRADFGGILFSLVRLGQVVAIGDILGTVTDPITNEQNLIYSTVPGRIIGMALNQVVMPGFAAFHIGIEAEAEPNGSALEPPPAPFQAPAETNGMGYGEERPE